MCIANNEKCHLHKPYCTVYKYVDAHIHSLMKGTCTFSFPLQIEVIECITFSITDPYPPPWICSLVLTKEDEKALLSGSWLSASHVSAVHKLLHKAFPNQEGLNDTSI